MTYSLLGFHLNWSAYDFFSEGHLRKWEVTLNNEEFCNGPTFKGKKMEKKNKQTMSIYD